MMGPCGSSDNASHGRRRRAGKDLARAPWRTGYHIETVGDQHEGHRVYPGI